MVVEVAVTNEELSRELRLIQLEISRVRQEASHKGHFWVLLLLILISLEVGVCGTKGKVAVNEAVDKVEQSINK